MSILLTDYLTISNSFTFSSDLQWRIWNFLPTWKQIIYSPLGWWSDEIMEIPPFWGGEMHPERLFEHQALVLFFPSCYKHIQDWYLLIGLIIIIVSKYDPPCRYPSVFRIMYFSRCTFLLFQADLICSFPVHISNLSKVALHYVSCSLVSIAPHYLPLSADAITVIGL